MTLWLVALVVAGAFEDTQKRFSIELPAEWHYAPMPGDLKGATFQRNYDGVPATCGIRFFAVDPSTSLDLFARQLAEAVHKEPGYKLLSEELDMLAGLPALRRRYVVSINGDAKWSKMAEDLIAVTDRRGILLHVETVAEAFSAFEMDFRALAGSLTLAGVKPGTAAAPTAAPKAGGPSLHGRWNLLGNPGVSLELRRDGTFELAGVRGVFRVDAGALHLVPVEGPGETYRWRIEGEELVLSSANLEEPARYRRAEAVAVPSQPAVVGRWEGQGHRLHPSPSGAAVADGVSGTYTLRDGTVVLKPTRGKKPLVLSYRFEGNALVVSGAGFGDEVKLERQP